MRRAGKRDRLLTLQRATYTTNALNEKVPSWANLAEAWAEMIPVKDWEKNQAQEHAAVADVRFRIDFDPAWQSLDPEDRIQLDDGRFFDIQGVAEIETATTLEISAQARAER